MEPATCEVTRSAGYDPTGEWAVECGAAGDYCPECDCVVCPRCHQQLASDLHQGQKKQPGTVGLPNERRNTG
jgi:hypothetical protein